MFSLTLCGLLVSLWWYYLYCPSVDRNQRLKENIAQLHTQIDTLSKSEQELSTLSQSISELKKNIENFSTKETPQQFLHTNLSCITQAATTSGMRIASCKVSSHKDKSWCSMNEIIGEFNGTYDQVICFFEHIKKSKRLIDVSRCDVARIDENSFLVRANFSTFYI